MKNRICRLLRAASLLGGLSLIAACASIGNPGGGPRDEDPPRMTGSSPRPYSVNVTPTKVIINFDETVNVKDAFSKVTVSPVSTSLPRVSSQGNRVIVEFRDTLQPDATYTIDFGDAIEDNNEGNKLQGFTFTFATGAEIDTLRVSGMVLSARDLEPQQGMLVGIQSDLSDSAFSKRPLKRVARTDDRGRFTVRGLRPGTYRIFALGDNDNDYTHANPEEDMAFLDRFIVPSTLPITVTDTIWNLRTGTVDSVVNRLSTRFLPDDILLRSFTPDAAQLYMLRHERVDSTRLRVIMSRNSPALPSLSFPAYPELDMKGSLVVEHNHTNDTILYWLRDHRLIANDSLRVAMSYLRTDSLYRLSPYADTLRFLTERPRKTARPPKKTPEQIASDSIARLFLSYNIPGGGVQDVNKAVLIDYNEPLLRLDTTSFRLEVKTDTVFRPVRLPLRVIRPDSLLPRRVTLEYPWAYDAEYRLTVDTLAAEGISGRSTRPLVHNFRTRKEDEYCSLSFTITGWPADVPAFVELLSSGDNPLRVEPVKNGRAIFSFLTPGKYYARITEDLDGDGQYTTGDYDSLRMPERTFYYPKLITVNKNWDKSETWDVWATPVDSQKPRKLLKNKPASDKRDTTSESEGEEEEEEETFDPTRNPFDTPGRRRE